MKQQIQEELQTIMKRVLFTPNNPITGLPADSWNGENTSNVENPVFSIKKEANPTLDHTYSGFKHSG